MKTRPTTRPNGALYHEGQAARTLTIRALSFTERAEGRPNRHSHRRAYDAHVEAADAMATEAWRNYHQKMALYHEEAMGVAEEKR